MIMPLLRGRCARTARLTLLVATMTALVAGLAGRTNAADPPRIDLATWTAPDIDDVKDDALGQLIKYGYDLFTDTANQIGPSVSDPGKRYAGNNLNCKSCHLQAGRQPYAMPVVGVWGQFPQYRRREGRVGTLEERINGCMERSMNGRALPLASREMTAYLAFMKWLSTGIPDGAKLVGAGKGELKEPGRAADLVHGKEVFDRVCAQCHGPDGLGKRAETGAGYQFPPLWGPDSFNDGAGMDRLLDAAAFIKDNMPLGTTFAEPVVSDDEAYDVAGFLVSAERPKVADLAKDYPKRLEKPVDAPYGPYADDFSQTQHKLGPFEPIRAKLKELAAHAGAPR